MRLPMPLLAFLLPLTLAVAQSSSNATSYALTAVISTVPPSPLPSSASATLTATPTGTPTTLVYTIFPTLSAGGNGTGYNVTNGTDSADQGPVLNPIGIDPAYGILGALLILSHVPLLLLGPKLRLYTPLLLTSHILSIVTLILILNFGVEPNLALHPPTQMLRGLYLLACLVAGGVGAGLAALWREYAEWGCGAVAGFALACWVEALRSGGVVQGEWRWMLYAGLVVGGFVLTTMKRIKMACLVAGTAIVGASGVMLGIDCFTSVGLKEFYIANLGFTALFPQFPADQPIPLTQSVVVELALIAALFLISLAIQLRVVPLLKAAKERQAEQRAQAQRESEEEKARVGLEGDYLRAEREEWEARHGRAPTGTGGTGTSSSSPLLDKKEEGRPSSQFSLLPFMPYSGAAGPTSPVEAADPRHSRSFSISKLQSTTDYLDAGKPGDRRSQSIGTLPALNLAGIGGEGSLGIPLVSMTSTPSLPSPSPSPKLSYRDPDTEEAVRDLKEKMALLDEIRTIKASIGKLKSDTGSLNLARVESRATYGSDASRARSVSGLTLDVTGRRGSSPTPAPGTGPASPTAGLGPEWDAYLKQRKLYVPPPLPQPVRAERVRQSDHVREAIEGRRRRESMLELGVLGGEAPLGLGLGREQLQQGLGAGAGRGYSYYDAQSAGLQVPGMAARRASAFDIPTTAASGSGPYVPDPQPQHPQGGQQRLPHRIVSPPPPAPAETSPVAHQPAQFTVVPDHHPLPHQRPARVASPPLVSPLVGPMAGVLSPRPQLPQAATPRIMTTVQLEARHRAALSGMQRPVSQMLLATQAQAPAPAQGKGQGQGSQASSSEGSGRPEEEQRRRQMAHRERERERERERDRSAGKERRRSSGGDLDRLAAAGANSPSGNASGEQQQQRRRGTGAGAGMGEVPFPRQAQAGEERGARGSKARR